MTNFSKLIIIFLLIAGCGSRQQMQNSPGLISDDLIIEKIADHTYRHISYLETDDFGKVPCNGMIVIDGQEAIIFDTTTGNETSSALIDWVQDTLHCKVKAVVSTHFHEDCLGGLPEFHKQGIPSYAHKLTIALAQQNNFTVPQHEFDQLMELSFGNEHVLAEYFGEGHTKDNVTGYFPAEKILFGGCLIKESGAGKGNLADANTNAWPSTIKKLKEKHPDIKIVIPGHGKPGGMELLDYTLNLFKAN